MKRCLAQLFTILLISNLSVSGQNINDSTEQSVIRKLELEWMTALQNKDTARLKVFCADNFQLAKVGGDESTTIKRDQWIQNALSMDWSNFTFRNIQVRVDSNIATFNTNLSFHLKPYPFKLSSGVIDIWMKHGNTWQVEKRYFGEDNLSRWLLVTIGIGIGILILVAIRWLRKPMPQPHHPHKK